MISNPARFFVSGSDTKSFTYKGGSKVYHFSPHDNKLSRTMENNIILFADDENHGLQILKELFRFAINCKSEYIKHNKGSKRAHVDEFIEEAQKEESKFYEYIKAIDAGKIKLTLAPTDQVYEVGWAFNDTIH